MTALPGFSLLLHVNPIRFMEVPSTDLMGEAVYIPFKILNT